MKFQPLYLVMALFAAACGGSSPSGSDANGTDAIAETPWEVDFQMAQHKATGCGNSECARAFFGIPVLKGGNEALRNRINNDVEALVRENIAARLPEPAASNDLDQLARSFVEGYELFKLEYPGSNAVWYFEMQGSRSSLTDKYFVLHLTINEFMGGAHPNTYTLLQNYSLTDGNVVDVRNEVDESELTSRAEAAFRKYHKLSPSAPLNDKGFMFPTGLFTLPENMALTEQGILLIYNPYEVAAYSMGTTELLLPYPADPS